MLVLGRKVGEVIWIGDEIRVMVVAIEANAQVKLGISAPPEVRIDRAEIRALRETENKEKDDAN